MLDENIRKLRKMQGISQVELAKALGVSKQTVANWENNNIQPTVEMLVKLSNYFSVSTNCLLGLDEKQYLEISGLSDMQLQHIRQIIDDIIKPQFDPHS